MYTYKVFGFLRELWSVPYCIRVTNDMKSTYEIYIRLYQISTTHETFSIFLKSIPILRGAENWSWFFPSLVENLYFGQKSIQKINGDLILTFCIPDSYLSCNTSVICSCIMISNFWVLLWQLLDIVCY